MLGGGGPPPPNMTLCPLLLLLLFLRTTTTSYPDHNNDLEPVLRLKLSDQPLGIKLEEAAIFKKALLAREVFGLDFRQSTCTADQFSCVGAYGHEVCLPDEYVCDGVVDCIDYSDELSSQCGNCTDPSKVSCSVSGQEVCLSKERYKIFSCVIGGKDVCISDEYRCDGGVHCSDFTDELSSQCGNCTDPSKFICENSGEDLCLSKEVYQCDGVTVCSDYTDELSSQCGNCTDPSKFSCIRSGVDVCLSKEVYQCNGVVQCNDFTDELVSQCGNCTDPSKFICPRGSQDVCLSKEEYRCNGLPDCDDLSDELPSVCGNCTTGSTELFMCRDQTQCVPASWKCDGDGDGDCLDGSDESTLAGCDHCDQPGALPCPGFPGNCGVLCDGRPTCPDGWDELQSTCRAHGKSCHGQGLHACSDGSMCIGTDELCNSVYDCHNGEDESSAHCRPKCSDLSKGYYLHPCDNGSCIYSRLQCSARTQSLCNDTTDMTDCTDKQTGKGTCYTDYVQRKVDQYRIPCDDNSRCILAIDQCNALVDCADGSDEKDCSFVVQIDLMRTILISLAGLVLSYLLFLIVDHRCTIKCTPPMPCFPPFQGTLDFPYPALVDPPSPALMPSPAPVPSILLHPAFMDMDSVLWCWQSVWQDSRAETILLNRDSMLQLVLLCHIEAQDPHPDSLYAAFEGLKLHMESTGVTRDELSHVLLRTFGHHRLAHALLKGPPNFLDRSSYEASKALDLARATCGWLTPLAHLIHLGQIILSPVFIMVDYVKDLVQYLILKGAFDRVERLERNCDTIQTLSECLVSSYAEKQFLDALLVSLIITIITTSMYCFANRRLFFPGRHICHDLLLILCFPLLPLIFHLKSKNVKHQFDSNKKEVSSKAYMAEKKRIDQLDNVMLQARVIEVTLETVVQIILIASLASFFFFSYLAPSGQRYSYFYSIAKIVIPGKKRLLASSLLISIFSVAWFFVSQMNHLKHQSLNMTRKLVLLVGNMLLLVARVGAITSTLVITVLINSDFYADDLSADASRHLDLPQWEKEFKETFADGLSIVSQQIGTNAKFLLGLLCLHMLVVALHAIFWSPKFPHSSTSERPLHLLSSLWLPLPYLTLRGEDMGEEMPQLWFLLALHLIENLSMMLASRVYYLHEGYPTAIIIGDTILVTCNLLGVVFIAGYSKYIALFSNIRSTPPPSNLPSYGPEDVAMVPEEELNQMSRRSEDTSEVSPSAGQEMEE